MDTEAIPHEEAVPGKADRPPPIVLTSPANMFHLQKQLKGVVLDNFEFRSTKNGTRIIKKNMADFSAVTSYLENNNLAYFTFCPKSLKPIKAVKHYLPLNTLAEDITDGLLSLGFDNSMLRTVTLVQQFMAEFNGAVSEEKTIVVITKIFLNLTKQK
jgi:hypothetical protein